ncbi:hypothetical protein ALT1644_180003 [Alteromonas macleodii]
MGLGKPDQSANETSSVLKRNKHWCFLLRRLFKKGIFEFET